MDCGRRLMFDSREHSNEYFHSEPVGAVKSMLIYVGVELVLHPMANKGRASKHEMDGDTLLYS